MLTLTGEGASIGWCQWYRWADYPAAAAAIDARPGEAGIDYAIACPGALPALASESHSLFPALARRQAANYSAVAIAIG